MAQAHNRLWARLLTGRVTEVFVIGGSLAIDLPQTLGLEPILPGAYLYTPDGIPRTGEEIAALAAELAASKRWISEGLSPLWTPAFMERAEAILLFDWPLRNAMQGNSQADPAVLAAMVSRWVAWRFNQRRASDGELTSALDAQSWRVPRSNPVADFANLAWARFPEKVLRVKSRRQLKILRKVRALPAQQRAPGSTSAAEPGA